MLEILKLISTINPGDTLSVSTMKVHNYNSLFTILTRIINNEDRIRTCSFIESIILNSIIMYKDTRDENLSYNIKLAINDALNLRQTYNNLTLFDNLTYYLN